MRSDPYSIREFARRVDSLELALVAGGLGASSLLAGTAVAARLWFFVAVALVAIAGQLVGLKRLDAQARGLPTQA